VDANIKLGHQPDERNYNIAADILKSMGITGIRLMTNNPGKIDAITKAGIKINSRVPVEIKPGDENRNYLETKKIKFNHHLNYV
jgi:3,4-dihydroxy 2-butanone 4-phosphate synthase/GTP cyclohydrolase II